MFIIINPNSELKSIIQEKLEGNIQYYPLIDLKNVKDDTLYFIDLSLSKYDLPTLDPELFSQELIEAGLSSSIRHLFFICSDINPEKPLSELASNLTQKLNQHFRKNDIIAYTTSDLNYHTWVKLSLESDILTWKVIGIKDIPQTGNEITESYLNSLNQEMLWEGTGLSIKEWLEKHPQKTFSSTNQLSKVTPLWDHKKNRTKEPTIHINGFKLLN